jgi:hypothetical protein
MGNSNKGLTNSRCRFDKASYTPVKTRQRDDGERGDVLARAVLVRSLMVTPSELVVLQKEARTENEKEAVNAVTQLMESRVADSAIRAAAALAEIPDRDLISIAGRLGTLRSELIQRLSAGVKELSENFDQVQHALLRARSEGGEMDQSAPATSGDEPSMASKVYSNMASLEGVESAGDRSETVRASMDRVPDLLPPHDHYDLTPMPAVRTSLYEANHQPVSVAANLLRPSLATLQLATAHPFAAATFGTIGASRLHPF